MSGLVVAAERWPTNGHLIAVAARLGVQVGTVHQWGQRHILPPPDGTVSGRPWWWPETIQAWAEATGRLRHER